MHIICKRDLNADGRAASATGRDVKLRHRGHLVAQSGEDHREPGSDFDGCAMPDPINDVTGVPRLLETMAVHKTRRAAGPARAGERVRLPRPALARLSVDTGADDVA